MLSAHKYTGACSYCGILLVFFRPGQSRPEPEEFLVIQTPADRVATTPGGTSTPVIPPSAPGVVPAPTGQTLGQTGRGGGVVCIRLSQSKSHDSNMHTDMVFS